MGLILKVYAFGDARCVTVTSIVFSYLKSRNAKTLGSMLRRIFKCPMFQDDWRASIRDGCLLEYRSAGALAPHRKQAPIGNERSARVQYFPCPCLPPILGRTSFLLVLLAYPDRAKLVGLILGDFALIEAEQGLASTPRPPGIDCCW